MPGFQSLLALCLAVKPPQGAGGAGAGCNHRIAGLDCCGDCRGELHPCFIPQRRASAPGPRRRVHSLHAADCSIRIAVRFWGIVAIGDSDGARRATAIGAHLLPRSRRSFLRNGFYAASALLTPRPHCASRLARMGRAFALSRTVRSVRISPRAARFGLVVTSLDRQLIADAVASRVLRRSAPRGPPSSFSV